MRIVVMTNVVFSVAEAAAIGLTSTITTHVFSVAEAGAHFDLPLRFLILTFHRLNTQNNAHK
jgi:hypothetical protein